MVEGSEQDRGHGTGHIGKGGSARDIGHIGRGVCTGQVILAEVGLHMTGHTDRCKRTGENYGR